MYSFWIIITSLILSTRLFSAPSTLQAGKAFFQLQNIDANKGDQIDDTYYPRLAAPNIVSATSFFTADVTPPPVSGTTIPPVYQLRAWMGGAMLWATGQLESATTDGYFVARNVPPSNVWPAELFQQAPVIANPITLQYSEPPGLFPSHTARGINFSLPYPYLNPDAAYGTACSAANAQWNIPPLTLEADPIPMVLIYPSAAMPVDGTTTDDTIWGPKAMLVDKMGDFSVDLIYQNPSSPYVRTAFTDTTGQGDYIKCTIVQGSPYIYFECRGVEFIALSNRITTHLTTPVTGLIEAATAPAAVPGVTDVQYSLLGGNQIDPGQFAATTTLNPQPTSTPLQDNYTTWAVYFLDDAAKVQFTNIGNTLIHQHG